MRKSRSYTASTRAIRIIYPITVVMPYIFALGYAQIPSFHSRHEEANKRFSGLSLTLPVAFFPIPPQRDGNTSRLRSAAIYPWQATRTKRFLRLQCASPHLWNQLPSSFRQPHCVYSPPGSPHPTHITSSQSSPSFSPSVTPSTFHSRLKTHLFHKSFPP